MDRLCKCIIDDLNYEDFLEGEIVVDGERKGFGLVPRNYETHPLCYSANARTLDMDLIDPNEYLERLEEKAAAQSGLQYIRRTHGPNGGSIPSLDQDGQGYCWNYSGTMCAMIARAVASLDYVRLSGHAAACMIKNFRDQGGWGAAGLEYGIEHGYPSVKFWPEKSMSRQHDNEATWENAKLHRVAEYFMDLVPPVYNRNISERQICTSLLLDCPGIGDFNWWGHSVALLALELARKARKAWQSGRTKKGRPRSRKGILATDFASLDLNNPKDAEIYYGVFAKRGISSWTDNWGDNGEFVLEGTRAVLNGGAAIRAVTPSIN